MIDIALSKKLVVDNDATICYTLYDDKKYVKRRNIMKKAVLSIFFFAIVLTSCGGRCKQGHTWEEATCTTAKRCVVCKLKEGEALGHNYSEPEIKKEASCMESGLKIFTCSICGETKEERIPRTEHTPGEWKVVIQPTATTKGRRLQGCSVCGTVINKEEFEKSPAEIKADFLSGCSEYTYEEISRNPDNYYGKMAHFRGEIIQSMESGDSYTFRVNITKGKYGYEDTILVSYTKKDSSESRLLEDDIVDLYGKLAGTRTYTAILGNEITVPLLNAEYVELR